MHKVVLGKNVAYLRDNAFSNANIKEFTVTGEEPPYCYPNVFGTKDLSNAKLYVPEDKVEYYRTTEPWTRFGTILTLDSTEPTSIQCATQTITLTITDGIVNIEDAPMSSLISVYTLDGEMYEAVRVKEKITSFTLPRNAMYIIKVGAKAFKVKI